jgi:hypothetical protein
MATENDTKSSPWSDDSRRDGGRAAPAWVQVRASAWPPEPIDDHDDPVDDEGDSPTTVSWGFPGNPVIAPTAAPAIAAFTPRAEPKAASRQPPPAPHEEEPVGVAPVARRQGKRSSLGTPDFLDRAAPLPPADRTPSPRAYYSNPAARPAAEEPRPAMTPPRDTRGGRRQDEPSKERRVADATGPQGARRGAERDFESKGTDVGFGGMRAAPPARGAQPMPAPSSSRMFEDDDPDKSDAWSSYSPPKPKRARGNVAPPPITPARQPVTAGGVNFSFLARVVLGIGLLMGAGALAITLLPRSAPTQVAGGEAPMLPVVGGEIPAADPPPPFDVQAPAAFRPQLLDGKDVSVEMIPEALAQARADGKLDLAAAYADKLARTASDPATFFPLGELLAQNGQTDAAFYWLVRGVHEFGARPERFVERQAFASLWTDARWDAFARWAVQVRRYQTSKGSAAPRVILPSSIEAAVALDATRRAGEGRPRGGRGGKPSLPVLFWFDPADGTGSQVQAWGQAVADELGVVVVNVLGPDRVGPMASAWSGDPARDRAQVDAALAAITTVTPDATRRYAAGIGQGGTWSVELAMRDPKFLAGALALHPTDEWRGPRDTSAESNRDRKQTVTLLAGGQDEDEHAFLRVERGRLLRAGVEAVMEIDDKAWPDNVPTDLKARLTTWVRARLSPTPNGAVPPAAAPGLPSVPSP